jgi:hypothetical protein
LSYGTNNRGGGYGNNIRKARRVQARRSDHAKEMDSVLKAPKAKNVDQWLSAPNRFDLPTVDENILTKPQFKQKLIEAFKALPEWKTAHEEKTQKILLNLEQKPHKIDELFADYCKSGKPFEKWFKEVW